MQGVSLFWLQASDRFVDLGDQLPPWQRGLFLRTTSLTTACIDLLDNLFLCFDSDQDVMATRIIHIRVYEFKYFLCEICPSAPLFLLLFSSFWLLFILFTIHWFGNIQSYRKSPSRMTYCRGSVCPVDHGPRQTALYP